MAAFNTQKVLSVHHWTDAYFTFTCTRDESLRFENGQFVMVGLMVDGKPLMRAYSVASANWEEHLEFFSIKVQDGPLTSRLQHLKVGDDVLISKKPTGTLVAGDLNPGKHLYLLSTGTGIAPFLSITKDPEIYEQFEKSSWFTVYATKKTWHTTTASLKNCPNTNTWAIWLKKN